MGKGTRYLFIHKGSNLTENLLKEKKNDQPLQIFLSVRKIYVARQSSISFATLALWSKCFRVIYFSRDATYGQTICWGASLSRNCKSESKIYWVDARTPLPALLWPTIILNCHNAGFWLYLYPSLCWRVHARLRAWCVDVCSISINDRAVS